MKFKLIAITLLLFLLIGITGCLGQKNTAGDQLVSPDKKTVIVEGFKFIPSIITINKGESVSWINHDSVDHTATGKIFDSGNLGDGATFKQSFIETGTFEYICSYHSGMKGTVVVK